MIDVLDILRQPDDDQRDTDQRAAQARTADTVPRSGISGKAADATDASDGVRRHSPPQSLMPRLAVPCWPSRPEGRKTITSRNRMKKNICP